MQMILEIQNKHMKHLIQLITVAKWINLTHFDPTVTGWQKLGGIS